MADKKIIQVSVRELVEFVLRRGDLRGDEGDFLSPIRALMGTRAHQKYQKSRPEGYKSEVPISHRIETPEISIMIKGRIDGLLEEEAVLFVEEIKSYIRREVQEPDPLHWAQLQIYAYLYLLQNSGFEHVNLQLTYVDIESGAEKEFRSSVVPSDLEGLFYEVVREYVAWITAYHEWCRDRDQSIRTLSFPHSVYRPGQRDLAVGVYRAVRDSQHLLAEAPTGIGKTISVLFPTIKALGEGKGSKIFYLTARTPGRAAAVNALHLLRHQGLKLRSLRLTARVQICFNEPAGSCEMRQCPFAKGYYDRIRPAVRELLRNQELNRVNIEEVARRHTVCPFELALDSSPWVDIVIGDYNHLFDPAASLRRFFSEEGGDYIFLVDEAHNLVDRAREMFSAALDRKELRKVAEEVKVPLPAVARSLRALERELRLWCQGKEIADEQNTILNWQEKDGDNRDVELTGIGNIPKRVVLSLRRFQSEAERWLLLREETNFRSSLRDVYFRTSGFLRVVTEGIPGHAVIVPKENPQLVRLFCLDPGPMIAKALKRGRCAVFFSATLTPLTYHAMMFGLEENWGSIVLPSPFPSENLGVFVAADVATYFSVREQTADRVASMIAAFLQAAEGNYIIFFPSYEYMDMVEKGIKGKRPEVVIMKQWPGMGEKERDTFLAAFEEKNHGTLAALAVMGGIFGEGIDLPGKRLIGVAVVGVGMPQINTERNLIKEYFASQGRDGFAFAYTFPGVTRVLQAAGRVIRSQHDQGAVLLMDERFSKAQYTRLMPEWWDVCYTKNAGELLESVTRFWSQRNSATASQA